MASLAAENLDLLLTTRGFLRCDSASLGLLSPKDLGTRPEWDLRYGSVLRRVDSGRSVVDLVYETPSPHSVVSGVPCVYFRAQDAISPSEIASIRRHIWNQGRSATLCVVTSDAIRLYDGYARPSEKDDHRSHILGELTRVGETLSGVEQFTRSALDSGAFWRVAEGRKTKYEERVDRALLGDLRATDELLRGDGRVSTSTAHSLLGRTVFVQYLEDRGLLRSDFLLSRFGASSFKDLLLDLTSTYEFFNWLRDTFNGDLFPVSQQERSEVGIDHLGILHKFLSGFDMRSPEVGQQRLWPYQFDVIPIELVSSIYEMFAHSADPQSAEARSVHYTRPSLVQMVLGLASESLNASSTVLDPACGSGAFLVEAFRRLVWLRSKQLDRQLSRSELREILRKQVFGVDIDEDAVRVAAFSLYLTLVELDPEPEPLEALRFPSLIHKEGDIANTANLHVQDFLRTEGGFNAMKPFSARGFDLIVGNPPWTALKPAKAPVDFSTGHKWSLEYCQREGIPDCKVDQAYMHRALDLACADTTIAFVVASRIFYQQRQEKVRWLDRFLGRCSLKYVVNLTDYTGEKILFGGGSSTQLPASVVVFNANRSSDAASVTLMSPQWHPELRQRDEILISGSDIRPVPHRIIRNDRHIWKTALRGTPRDDFMLDKLTDLPSLDVILRKVAYIGRADQGRGVTIGKGAQKDASMLYGLPYLAAGQMRRYRLRESLVSPFSKRTVAAKSNRTVFAQPTLILSRSLIEEQNSAAVCDLECGEQGIVIDQTYYGISVNRSLKWLLHRLSAVLNSRMALYQVFLAGSALGWDRRLIEVEDWLQLRLPSSVLDESAEDEWSRVIELEDQLGEYHGRARTAALERRIRESQKDLDSAVYALYDLSEQDAKIIDDTIEHSFASYIGRHDRRRMNGFGLPTERSLEAYSTRVCSQLNGLLRFSGLGLSATTLLSANENLCAIRFTLSSSGSEHEAVHLDVGGTASVFGKIPQYLQHQVADHLCVRRDLRVYEPDGFWIIKPAESRLWTELAAINDSDTVVQEHMEAVVDPQAE